MNGNRGLRGFAARNLPALVLLVAGLAFLGIGMYGIHASQQDFSRIGLIPDAFGADLAVGFTMIQQTLRSQILALISVVGGAILMLGGAVHAGNSESVSKMGSQLVLLEASMAADLRRGISVHENSRADEIWLNSARMLSDLSEKGYGERHAYDVTSYFNRVRYEELVAQCVAQGVSFQRVFCFRVQNKQPSDELMAWYLRSIETGLMVTLEELSKMSFKRDLLLAFKEHEGDTCPSDLTTSHIERINHIICDQRKAMDAGNLTITSSPRRMPMDFVVIEYVAEAGQPQEYEVQANFKTAPLVETYVAGVHGRGAFARHYQQLFKNIIYPGVV